MCLAESEQKDDHSLVWYLKEFTTTKSLNTQKHRLYHVFQILVEAERSWTKLNKAAWDRMQKTETGKSILGSNILLVTQALIYFD